jgi:hypothetical protein
MARTDFRAAPGRAYRPCLSDPDWEREAGADAAGGEEDGRDPIVGACGAGDAAGAENDGLGAGAGREIAAGA